MKINDYFWTQRENIPKGLGYNQFSIKHIMMLIGTAIFACIVSYIYINSNSNIKSLIRISIAVTLMLIEVLKLLVIHFNNGDVVNYIPIEICSFAAYCIVVDAFSQDITFLKEMLLIVFLPAAIMALIYPTTISLPVFNFYTIHQFLFHGLIVTYVTMLFVSKEIVINYAGVWKSILTILCISGVVYIIDRSFNRNYMFLMHDEGSSMLKIIYEKSGGGIKYTGSLVLFSIIMIHVFFLIFKLLEMLLIS